MGNEKITIAEISDEDREKAESQMTCPYCNESVSAEQAAEHLFNVLKANRFIPAKCTATSQEPYS